MEHKPFRSRIPMFASIIRARVILASLLITTVVWGKTDPYSQIKLNTIPEDITKERFSKDSRIGWVLDSHGSWFTPRYYDILLDDRRGTVILKADIIFIKVIRTPDEVQKEPVLYGIIRNKIAELSGKRKAADERKTRKATAADERSSWPEVVVAERLDGTSVSIELNTMYRLTQREVYRRTHLHFSPGTRYYMGEEEKTGKTMVLYYEYEPRMYFFARWVLAYGSETICYSDQQKTTWNGSAYIMSTQAVCPKVVRAWYTKPSNSSSKTSEYKSLNKVPITPLPGAGTQTVDDGEKKAGFRLICALRLEGYLSENAKFYFNRIIDRLVRYGWTDSHTPTKQQTVNAVKKYFDSRQEDKALNETIIKVRNKAMNEILEKLEAHIRWE